MRAAVSGRYPSRGAAGTDKDGAILATPIPFRNILRMSVSIAEVDVGERFERDEPTVLRKLRLRL
jgi:hypothetical protein